MKSDSANAPPQEVPATVEQWSVTNLDPIRGELQPETSASSDYELEDVEMADIEDLFNFEFDVSSTAHVLQTDAHLEGSSGGGDYSPNDDSSDDDYSPSDGCDDEYFTPSRARATTSSTTVRESSDAPETTASTPSDRRPPKTSSSRNPPRSSPSRNKKKKEANGPNPLNNSEKSSDLTKYEMGLGKTPVACAVMCYSRMLENEINRVYNIAPRAKQIDLIIAPLSVHSLWVEHLTRLSGGWLKVAVWQGGQVDPSVEIITIETLRTHYSRFLLFRIAFAMKMKAEVKTQENYLLAELGWQRFAEHSKELRSDAFFMVEQFRSVTIDECQVISNWRTLNARAVLTLKTDNFLELSGTPAQNFLNDYQVHIALTRTHLSYRKDVSEAEMEHWMKKREKSKAVPSMSQKDILAFVNVHDFPNNHPNCIITCKAVSSETGEQLVVLPKRHECFVKAQLNEEKQMIYNKINSAKMATVLRILRLRQSMSRALPLMTKKEALEKIKGANADVGYTSVVGGESDEVHYQIVIDIPPDFQISCNVAIWKEVKAGKGEGEDLQRWERQKLAEVCSDQYISSKLKAVFAILKRVPQGEKTLIFSMFPSLLDVLGSFLEKNGIEYVQCLNIVACNHVIVFDPWWNPYVEEQAIARAYRRGQTREVHVYRILCPKTIEDWILKVKEKKRIAIDAFTEECAMVTHFQDVNEPLD
ncbi:hypothetical protein EST38_g11563 [Candolleomyces aberdarensis]|uniref:Uncharacterized protein n=1 Tax=Candolleomyces aberdarensis TaxID=2316362 RepID=A0A4Q2D4L1_9AGAR|nr:hypothetical protein EST38_g11563 [Candolleomyces aberdarensis]